MFGSTEGSSILTKKLGKIVADRKNSTSRQEQPLVAPLQDDARRSLTATPVMKEQISAMLNGNRIDVWHQHSQLEDQEVIFKKYGRIFLVEWI